jgi:peptidoglycan hydrolase FlgJ
MTSISNFNATATAQLPMALPSRDKNPISLPGMKQSPINLPKSEPIPLGGKSDGKSAQELHEKFTQFVGEAFYGQMFKAMRSTVGKPAYFNGGHAEEVFQGQLDQTMAEQLTKTTSTKFADPLFDRQFPHLAEAKTPAGLDQLNNLRRR